MARRPATENNNLSILRQFVVFLCQNALSFKSIDHEIICAYIEKLADRVKSPATIRNYISSLHVLYIRMNLPAQAFIHLSVRQAMMATDKTKRHIPSPAVAISPSTLRRIIYVLSSLKQAPTLKCVFTIMYVSMLRQSNFAPNSQSSFDKTRHLTRGDCTIQPNGLRIRVKWEKNMQSSTGCAYMLLPYANDPLICPVRAYADMVSTLPTLSPGNPLAMFHNYRPIPLFFLQKAWRKAIVRLNMDPKRVRLHGLRRGAATYIASRSTRARDRLQEYGRWRSNAYRQYIDDPAACPIYEAFKKL